MKKETEETLATFAAALILGSYVFLLGYFSGIEKQVKIDCEKIGCNCEKSYVSPFMPNPQD